MKFMKDTKVKKRFEFTIINFWTKVPITKEKSNGIGTLQTEYTGFSSKMSPAHHESVLDNIVLIQNDGRGLSYTLIYRFKFFINY